MNQLTPITREIFWNTGLSETGMIILDVIVFLSILGFFTYHFLKRMKLYRIGKPFEIKSSPALRLKQLMSQAILQKALLREKLAGLAHVMLYTGFIVLFIGTVLISIREYITIPLLDYDFYVGNFYIIYSFLLDLFGLLAIIGTVIFAIRRFITRPEKLTYNSTFSIVLIWIFVVLITGFLVEGARIAVHQPDFEKWSFVGWFLASFLPTSVGLHQILWWVHFVASIGLIFYIVPSTLRHIFVSSANQFYSESKLEPKGAMKPIDPEEFETAETFGVATIEDLTWKQLLNADACTNCGRCQDVCPAWNTNKPLSPKQIMVKTYDYWLKQGPVKIRKTDENGNSSIEIEEIVPNYITADEIWACTNCRACVESCPVGIDQVEIINDVRRNLVMVRGEMPESLEVTMRNMETQGNPWGLGSHRKEEWSKDLGVPLLREKGSCEVLFYVGCAGAFNDRNQMVTRAMAKILNAAGVDYAILGEEEKCCGDQARRAGNEYLFQMMAMENIELFNRYGIKTIVTTCPHGYHTFKKEYPQFDGNFEVYHHTEFIPKLVKENKLVLNNRKIEGFFTYHDSCFLTRYNGIYDEPREILNSLGIHIKELPRAKENNFCCGAGGARMWMEEEVDQRVNIARSKEIMESGADKVALGCPFCMTMISDGLKEFDESKEVLDFAEIIAMGINEGEQS
ncbi:MAG: heterodisulfide reductase-related iron-sulfur binding cluster [Calditrichia bacterium]